MGAKITFLAILMPPKWILLEKVMGLFVLFNGHFAAAAEFSLVWRFGAAKDLAFKALDLWLAKWPSDESKESYYIY